MNNEAPRMPDNEPATGQRAHSRNQDRLPSKPTVITPNVVPAKVQGKHKSQSQ